MRKEDLEFDEQVESWPYLFWPPLPQWYILPFKKLVTVDAMVHDMNTTDRLEQFAVSGLFSNTHRPDYGGNLFYTNIIIPLFHTYTTKPAEGEQAETATVWSFLHYKKGGEIKQDENGEFARDEENITQKVYWHVLTKWHAREFEARVKAYVNALTIDGILDDQPIFIPTPELVVRYNVSETDNGVWYHNSGDANIEQYGQDSFLFCLLAIGYLALEMDKDPSVEEKITPPFNTQNLTLRHVNNAGANAPGQVNVSDAERAAAILLLGIRDVFKHSRIGLFDPAQIENNPADAELDLDMIAEDNNNRWAKASAEWVRGLSDMLRLSAKMSFGGPYNSVEDAAEGGDGDDDNNDNGSDNGNNGGEPSGVGGGSESIDGKPFEKPQDEAPEKHHSNAEDTELSRPVGHEPVRDHQNAHHKDETTERKAIQEDSTKPGHMQSITVSPTIIQPKGQGASELAPSSPTCSGSEEFIQTTYPSSNDAVAEVSPTSHVEEGTMSQAGGHAKTRKRSRDSLFSESSEDEEEQTAKKPKLFGRSSHAEDGKGHSEDKSWEGFDDEVEAAMKYVLNESSEKEYTDSSEDEKIEEEGGREKREEGKEHDEDEEESEEAEDAEREPFKAPQIGTVDEDIDMDSYAAERKHRYLMYHKADRNVEYIPDQNMLYASI